MKPSTLHVISAAVGAYSLLIPANYILEITIPNKQNTRQMATDNKPKTIDWNKYNIPLLIINNRYNGIISHLIVLRSLFNKTYQYYALACYAIPQMIKITQKDIHNTIVNTNNSNIKYQTTIKDTLFFIADFGNIETMLSESHG